MNIYHYNNFMNQLSDLFYMTIHHLSLSIISVPKIKTDYKEQINFHDKTKKDGFDVENYKYITRLLE